MYTIVWWAHNFHTVNHAFFFEDKSQLSERSICNFSNTQHSIKSLDPVPECDIMTHLSPI